MARGEAFSSRMFRESEANYGQGKGPELLPAS